jgi:hypothetical protein
MLRTLAAMLVLAGTAQAHEMYTNTKDPVSGYGCCGGNDCAAIPADWIEPTPDGYRLKLTLEQARKVNANAVSAVDAIIPWSRIQPSHDLQFHACLFNSNRSAPYGGVICFWQPPST